jgi:hypothetical protein
MRSRILISWIALMLVFCVGAGSAAAGSALLPGDGDDERRVTLTSRRPARQPKPPMPRAMSRLVLVSRTPAPARPAPPATAPDGQVYCWRRHANGQLAAVVGHADGTLTARLWPCTETFSTGIHDLADAQRAADALAHEGNRCACGRPWNFS